MPKPPKRKKNGIGPRKKKRTAAKKTEGFLAIPNFTDSSPGLSQSTDFCESEDYEGSTANEFYVVLGRDVVKVDPDFETDQLYYNNHYEQLRLKFLRQQIPSEFVYNSAYKDTIQFLAMYHSDTPTVKLSVTINRDFNALVTVHGKSIEREHDIWIGLPKVFMSIKDILRLLNKLLTLDVCPGNYREELQSLVPVGCGLSLTAESNVQAYREMYIGPHYLSTIRHVNCQLLVGSGSCTRCRVYGGTLRKKLHRQQKQDGAPVSLLTSRRKETKMSHLELRQKLAESKKQTKSLKGHIETLERQLRQKIEQYGEVLNDVENMEVSQLQRSVQELVEKEYPDSTCFQRLFWEQQVKFNKSKGPKGMRWHPMIIRWCLLLRSKSQKAYDVLRETGFVSLPSNRTLYDYSHFNIGGSGLKPETIDELRSLCSAQGVYEVNHRQYVGLLQDEVKVRDELVYDKHTGELIGYVDLDSVANQLNDLRNIVQNQAATVARYVLVLMVRGATTGLKFPLANYATDGISSYFLYPIIWTAVQCLETDLDLRVVFITCDGASPNRKFFTLHKVGADANLERVVYRCVNYCSPNRLLLYFISDVPHLVKTVRNCFSNSQGHSNTRLLWNGDYMLWEHIVRLYEQHCDSNLYSLCPKLSRSHIDLTGFSKMKVNLAVQVMSASVANALEFYYGEEVSATVELIKVVNKFFDCLNTKNLYEGQHTRNNNLDAYVSTDDARLSWLLNDCLGYFQTWFDRVSTRRGDYTKSDRARMVLSHQTLTGLEITIRSISELVVMLLECDAPFVMTANFNQDPLEQHFGHYRHKGGANDNPTVYQVQHTMTQLRTVGCLAINRRGNVEGNRRNGHVDNAPLPRRS